MRTKTVLLGCLTILTAVVVFSVSRIEYLNAIGGHVLPRHELAPGASVNWEIAELNVVLQRLDDQFMERREHAALVDATESGAELAIPIYGPPYSDSEKRSIASATRLHEVLTKLHWSIRNIGWPQYFLAPAALLLAAICGLGWNGIGTKVFSSLCGGLSCVAILLVLVRGYWQSL